MAARVEDLLAKLERFFAPLVPAFTSAQGLERFLRSLGDDGTQANLAGGDGARPRADRSGAAHWTRRATAGGGPRPQRGRSRATAAVVRSSLRQPSPASRPAHQPRPAGHLRGRLRLPAGPIPLLPLPAPLPPHHPRRRARDSSTCVPGATRAPGRCRSTATCSGGIRFIALGGRPGGGCGGSVRVGHRHLRWK